MKNTIVTLMTATLLAACGGNDSSSTSQPVNAQSKQLQRSDKAVASDYQTLVQELYVAYFGRPADPTGLTNFENALLAANAPTDIQSLNATYATSPAIQSLINSFGASAESIALYGTGNPSAFVTAIFQNVLGRAPQPSGLTYWVNAITSSQLSQGDAALAIMAGALSNTTAQGVLDAALIENRLTVAANFTAEVAGRDVVSAYAGATAAASARTTLSAVTATTNPTSYETTVITAVAALETASLSGNTLQIIDTAIGTGALAVAGDTASVNYAGFLYNAAASNFAGAEFDSTAADGGKPLTFLLGTGEVITGFDQGVIGMKVGGTRTLIIPSSLAYGAAGNGPIPPNAPIIFNIQLLSVTP
jgi:FKBP-type peptidyl-prolyl cis-trans isomerase